MRKKKSFDWREPLYDQLELGMVFVTREDGQGYRIVFIDEAADVIELEALMSGENRRFDADEMWGFCDHEAFRVADPALRDPSSVIDEYAGFHLSRDISVLGRMHEHHVADVYYVGDIEFAYWAADVDAWPPDDEIGFC